MDIELITEAKELRKEGLSFKNIGVSMGITKSKARYLCSLDINEVETKIKNHVLREEEICLLVPKCNSINEIIKILGHKGTSEYYKQIQKIINKYNLDTSHFGTINNNTQKSKKRKIEEILIEDIDINISKLRDRLIKEGIKEYKCEECGLTEWNNKPIPLQLHHINGNRRDNRLENLRILCPNCHAQTDNFCGKNVNKPKRRNLNKIERYEKVKEVYGEEFAIKTFGIIKQKENKPKQKKFCPVCGKELKKSEYTYCSLECSHKSTKKLPEDDIIINHINNGLTNQEIGDMYGVTEACVRKWKKKHNI